MRSEGELGPVFLKIEDCIDCPFMDGDIGLPDHCEHPRVKETHPRSKWHNLKQEEVGASISVPKWCPLRVLNDKGEK